MALQMSVAVRNAKGDAMETAIGASAVMKIRTGLAPANCATADAGTVLATLNLPADYLTAAANGVKTLLGSWQDAAADASGFAGHFRIYASDGVTCHMQGNVSQNWAASTVYAVNQQVNLGGNVYRCTAAGTSASSGGPSGQGGSITDGGVTWAYVGTSELVIDNSNLATGQSFTVNAFSLTEGNA